MPDSVIGYDGNHPVFRNAYGGCYEYWDETDPSQGTFGVACPTGSSPATPVPTYPVGGGVGIIQPGGSWYNDLLNTILGLSAIGSHGSITGQGINAPQQYQYPQGYNPYGQVPSGQGGVAVVAGNTLGTFVQKNATVLLIGAGLLFLWKSGRK